MPAADGRRHRQRKEEKQIKRLYAALLICSLFRLSIAHFPAVCKQLSLRLAVWEVCLVNSAALCYTVVTPHFYIRKKALNSMERSLRGTDRGTDKRRRSFDPFGAFV